MAYSWEPRWEAIKVESHGIVFRTCRDKVTKMITCPICINASTKCLGLKTSSEYETTNIFFYTYEDLIIHIRDYHVYRFIRSRLMTQEGDSSTRSPTI